MTTKKHHEENKQTIMFPHSDLIKGLAQEELKDVPFPIFRQQQLPTCNQAIDNRFVSINNDENEQLQRMEPMMAENYSTGQLLEEGEGDDENSFDLTDIENIHTTERNYPFSMQEIPIDCYSSSSISNVHNWQDEGGEDQSHYDMMAKTDEDTILLRSERQRRRLLRLRNKFLEDPIQQEKKKKNEQLRQQQHDNATTTIPAIVRPLPEENPITAFTKKIFAGLAQEEFSRRPTDKQQDQVHIGTRPIKGKNEETRKEQVVASLPLPTMPVDNERAYALPA